MTPQEAGFLLLASSLGDPGRRPLTLAQLRTLGGRAAALRARGMEDRSLCLQDLTQLGYGPQEAGRILALLDQGGLLRSYLRRAQSLGIRCLTRISPGYPSRLTRALGREAPPVVWLLGDCSLLQTPCMAVVGSRELRPENRAFAVEAGAQIARQGFTLVSGGARGADSAAQEACRRAGGCAVIVLADSLAARAKAPLPPGLLYCSLDSFDLPFSPHRALGRNPIIHILAEKTLVAQTALGSEGTWSGTAGNLKHGWSPVFLYDDGSAGARALLERGAAPVTAKQLADLRSLTPAQCAFFAP